MAKDKKETQEEAPAKATKAKPERREKAAKTQSTASGDGSMPKVKSRMEQFYHSDIAPKLKTKFNFTNVMQIPRIQKIVVNIGCGDARENQKHMEKAVDELRDICGQKPVVTKARQAISNFKIRQGMNIGCFVTLRGQRMWAFLEKLIGVSLPRVRDFRGISANAFDGRGNYNLGLREQLIFPEINADKAEKVRGMNVTIVTSAKNDVEARELLTELGMPFRK
jgi:large subunit ribosomal protein L5